MRFLQWVILTTILSVLPANADTKQEIQHLLDYVESTDCQYDRNGRIYTGSEARDHINTKYEYYGDKIDTTEDFIKYAATKSLMSGEKYKIHCQGDEPVYAADWLLLELRNYRENNK